MIEKFHKKAKCDMLHPIRDKHSQFEVDGRQLALYNRQVNLDLAKVFRRVTIKLPRHFGFEKVLLTI